MKLKTIFHRAAAGALCLILCVSALAQTALAYEPLTKTDLEGPCSLTINAYPCGGITVKLYKVADWKNTSVQFEATSEFAPILQAMSNTNYKNLNSPKTQKIWNELAAQLSQAISSQRVTELRSATTDSKGTVSFQNLEPGLYLILNDSYTYHTSVTNQSYHVLSSARLICLPNWMKTSQNAQEHWEKNVVMNAKVSQYLDNKPYSITVVKLWQDADGKTLTSHPNSVTVELYRNGVKVDTRVLNSNNWSYRWDNLYFSDGEYSVREVLPSGSGYSTSIKTTSTTTVQDNAPVLSMITYTITNTLDKNPDPTPTPSYPVSSQPVSSQPVSSQPVSSQPVSSQPVSSQPVSSQPVSSQPVSSQPVSSSPVTTSPPDVELEDPDTPLGDLPSTDPNDPPEEIELDDPDVPLGDLPQTGQLWWPVPLMGVLGLLLLLIGLVRRRGSEYDEE